MDEQAITAQTQDFVQAEAARAAQELGVPDETPNVEQPTEAPAAAEVAEEVVEEVQTPQPGDVVQPQAVPEPEDDDEEFLPSYPLPQYQQQAQPVAQVPAPQQQLAPLNPSQFTDQYGNVDMARFSEAMNVRDQQLAQQVAQSVAQNFSGQQNTFLQQAAEQANQLATQRVLEAQAEDRAWRRTIEKYPEVGTNKDLRDQIQKMRLGEVATQQKNVSPVKVADRFFKLIGQAREEGVKQATQTVRTQSSAHLETANNTASEKGLKSQQDWSKIDSRDRRESDTARKALLKQLLADGKI